MTQDRSNDNWKIIEESFEIKDVPKYETLFALGNGTLGMRGNFEEGLGKAAIEGTFINGFYESAPIIYGEKFIGFAENKQTILNLANARLIRLWLETDKEASAGKLGEELNLLDGKILSYHRELDLREGCLRRKLEWESPKGRRILLETERLVLHTHPHLAIIYWQVTPVNFDGEIIIFSGIDGAIRQSEHAEEDPRLGTQFKGDVLQLIEQRFAGTAALMVHRTVTTQFRVACGVSSLINAECQFAAHQEGQQIGLLYRLQAKRGNPISLEKHIAYVTSLEQEDESTPVDLSKAVLRELQTAEKTGYPALKEEQVRFMSEFWQAADIRIEGDDALQRGIRFNMFHLLQSAGRDGRINIAAKGLTGLGYEGHYFWDTEIYILPFFLYTHPEIARKLLEYRYHILDQARQRARQMSHRRGALYAWRTINGEECSANFPTGTAQYHINADIAFAIQRYFDATGDADFMQRYGVEILCETARLWIEAGATIPSHAGKFCINGVTGPDEYQILVNNNAYTNLMARENLRFAAEMVTWMRTTDLDRYAQMVARIGLSEVEPFTWQQVADNMYVPYDPERGIIPQDDGFLFKQPWDFANTPPENYPLLLHYHPLVVMRYQVCKQADTVLAEFLLHDQFDCAQKERDFSYYEPLTTHDSSLSGAIWGIMACELGEIDKAYRYFAETAIMDLEDRHGNTQAGIHAANMAGAWQGIVFGFAGMRAKDGLSFNPGLPCQWQSYSFKVRYRGRLVSVQVKKDGASFDLLEGEPLEIKVGKDTFFLARAFPGKR